ncbi:MAG: hypothetical protein ACLU0O_12480 [Collinsella sp.]
MSQAVVIAAGALDAIPQLSVWARSRASVAPMPEAATAISDQGRLGGRRLHHLEGCSSQAYVDLRDGCR